MYEWIMDDDLEIPQNWTVVLLLKRQTREVLCCISLSLSLCLYLSKICYCLLSHRGPSFLLTT